MKCLIYSSKRQLCSLGLVSFLHVRELESEIQTDYPVLPSDVSNRVFC